MVTKDVNVEELRKIIRVSLTYLVVLSGLFIFIKTKPATYISMFCLSLSLKLAVDLFLDFSKDD